VERDNLTDLSQLVQDIATDLCYRFRAMAMAIDQADRFVGMTETGEADSREAGWFLSLAQRSEEVDEIAEDLILRAFRTALEPDNYAILQGLGKQPSVSCSDLMKASGMNRLSVSERVNDLIQVGLVIKDVQTDQVQGTKAAHAILQLFGKAQVSLRELILDKLATG